MKGRTVVVHLDNASYHKGKQKREINCNKATTRPECLGACLAGMRCFGCLCVARGKIGEWLVANADTSCGFTGLEDFEDEDGNMANRNAMRSLAKQCTPPNPSKVESLVKRFGGIIEFTPPYWPQSVT